MLAGGGCGSRWASSPRARGCQPRSRTTTRARAGSAPRPPPTDENGQAGGDCRANQRSGERALRSAHERTDRRHRAERDGRTSVTSKRISEMYAAASADAVRTAPASQPRYCVPPGGRRRAAHEQRAAETPAPSVASGRRHLIEGGQHGHEHSRASAIRRRTHRHLRREPGCLTPRSRHGCPLRRPQPRGSGRDARGKQPRAARSRTTSPVAARWSVPAAAAAPQAPGPPAPPRSSDRPGRSRRRP